MTVYELATGYFEEGDFQLFTGPDDTDWSAVCDECLDLAAQQCLLRNGHGADFKDPSNPTYIGLGDIASYMVPLLEQRGFKKLETVRQSYWGGGILDFKHREDIPVKPSTKVAIIQHNADICLRQKAYRNKQ